MPLNPTVVLVVEDDPEIREVEIWLLSSEGYRVVGVADGEHVPDEVKRVGASLVLLDLMLPKKNGGQVLTELGADPATAMVPVVVVSAYMTDFMPQLRSCPQVRRMFEKPFDGDELVAAVVEILEAPTTARG